MRGIFSRGAHRAIIAAALIALTGCGDCGTEPSDSNRDDDSTPDMKSVDVDMNDTIDEPDSPADVEPDMKEDAPEEDMPPSVDMKVEPLEVEISTPSVAFVHEPIEFIAKVTGEDDKSLVTYDWTFDDGQLGRGERVARIWSTPQTVTVDVQIKHDDGRTASDTFELVLEEPTSTTTATIHGVINDQEGSGLGRVDVLDRDGNHLATTDASGRFSTEVPSGIPYLLVYERRGYTRQFQRIELPTDDVAAQNYRVVNTLTPVKHTEIIENVGVANEVVLDDGTTYSFPPFAFVDESGEPVEGQLAMSVTPVTPDNGRVYGFQGSYFGIDGRLQLEQIATFGSVEVRLEQNGQEVQLADGVTATIEIPIDTIEGVRMGELIPLWSLDEESGIWIQEGSAEVIAHPTIADTYMGRAEVSHFSTWNVDAVISRAFITFAPQFGPGDLEVPLDRFIVDSYSIDPQLPVTRSSAPVSIDGQTSVIEADGYCNRVSDRESCTLGFFSDFEDGEPATLSVADSRDLATKMELGVPVELDFDDLNGCELDSRQFLVSYDPQPGVIYQLEIEVKENSDVEGTIEEFQGCAPPGQVANSIFRPGVLRTIVLSQTQPGGDNLVSLQAMGGEGTIVVTLSELGGEFSSRDTISPGEEVEYDWVDDSSQTYILDANKGQQVHLLVDGVPRDAYVEVYDKDGEKLAIELLYPLDYEGLSYTFVMPDSEPKYLKVFPGAAPSEESEITLSVGEVFAPIPIALSSVTTHYTDEQDIGAADVIGYKVLKFSNYIMDLRPEVSQPDELPGMIIRGTRNAAAWIEPPTPELQGFWRETAALGEFTTVNLFQPRTSEVTSKLTIEFAREQDAYVVGDPDTCEGVTHRSLSLAALAAAEGAVIELCPGTHLTYEGLEAFAKSIDVVGLGAEPSDTIITQWPAKSPLLTDDGFSRFENLTFDLTGKKLEFDWRDTDRDPPELRGVNIRGEVAGIFSLALDIRARNEASVGAPPIVIDTLDIDLDHAINGLTVKETRALEIRDVTIADARTGMDLEANELTVEGVYIEQDDTDPNAMSVDIIKVELVENGASGDFDDVHVISKHTDNVGVSIRNTRDADIHFDGVRIDASSQARTMGIEVRSTAPSGSKLTIQNSVFANMAHVAMQLNNLDKFDLGVSVYHNTLQFSGASNFGFTLSRPPAMATEIFNNIIAADAGVTVGTGIDLDNFAATADNVGFNLFFNVTNAYDGPANLSSIPMNGDITGDPMFGMMLELLPGSPAVDVAKSVMSVTTSIDGTARPMGMGPDIGAYER